MKINDFYNDIEYLFEEVGSDNRINDFNNQVKLILLHLFNRIRRLFSISRVILNSDIDNNYVELIPTIRVVLDCYLHLRYISQESDKKRVLREYETLALNNKNRMAKEIMDLNALNKNKVSPDELKFAKKFIKLDKDKLTDIRKISSMKCLAKYLGEFELYVLIYNLSNQFIHFNQSTLELYGEFIDEETFAFNYLSYDEILDHQVQQYLSGIVLNALNIIISVFDLGYSDKLEKLKLNWVEIFKENSISVSYK